jgi:hypothetical protein
MFGYHFRFSAGRGMRMARHDSSAFQDSALRLFLAAGPGDDLISVDNGVAALNRDNPFGQVHGGPAFELPDFNFTVEIPSPVSSATSGDSTAAPHRNGKHAELRWRVTK